MVGFIESRYVAMGHVRVRSITMKKRSLQELSELSKKVYFRLVTVPTNEMVTYFELSKLIGRNVQKEGRFHLDTARKMAMRDDKIVFGTVRNEGVKRLDDVAVVETGQGSVTKVRRACHRGVRVVTTANYSQLPNEMKHKRNMYVSVLGALEMATKAPNMRRLEQKVTTSECTLSIGRTLDAFL